MICIANEFGYPDEEIQDKKRPAPCKVGLVFFAIFI
jgi:hypothetical protein